MPLYTILVPAFYFFVVLWITQQERNYGFGNIVFIFLALFLLFFGLLLWVILLISLGKNLTVYPEGHHLVTTGVYKLFRHPFYVGINATFLGMSMLCGSWLGLGATLILIIPLNIFRAKSEEVVLREAFGKAYEEYVKKVWFSF